MAHSASLSRTPHQAHHVGLGRVLLLGAWLLLLLLPALSQAVTVTRSPVNSGSCTGLSSGGSRPWNYASRAWADDNSFARSGGLDGTSSTSRYLQCLNYGFSIPVSATITGIRVNVARRASSTANGGLRDNAVRVVKGGVVQTAVNRATSTPYTTGEVNEAHGSSTDLWGVAWTPADINAANFGAVFSAYKPSSAGNSQSVRVDVISITVDYAPDTTPPTVRSIVRASPNPASGTSVAWTVSFSEAVTGVDAGDFALASSGIAGAAITAVSGSGTTWTVTASTGTSGATGTLGLNLVDNDSIVDAAGNRLAGVGTNNGSMTGQVYTVDRLNPNMLSLTRSTATPTNLATLSWVLVFSKAVTGVDLSDFTLAGTGTVSASLASVTGSGTTWTITASGVTGTGTLRLDLVDDDTIMDALFNRLGGTGLGNGSQTGETYEVDRNAPTVLQITRNDPSPNALDEVSWTVVFSEPVTGVDMGDFNLVASGLAGATLTSLSGSDTTWTVVADPGYGAGTLGLNLVDNDSIVDALANPLGGSGANNGDFTGEVYSISTDPVASYRMEEASWNGTADQVSDQQASYPGTARNGATTANLSQALTGSPGTCRYGLFTSTSAPVISKGYVDLGSGFPYFLSSFSITAWVRTTSNSSTGQLIFSHNSGGQGYTLSLGTAGAGRLRFSSGGASSPNLDSPSTTASLLANDTWYFVAAVADFATDPDVVRKIYVYDTSGTLLPGFPVSLTTTGWDDTETGAATLGGDGSTSFRGWMDELQVFDKALNPLAVAALAQSRHPCSTSVPDHYQVALASNSLSCQPTTVTVTACADSSSPCSNPFTAAAGTTATLASSAGSLSATSITFDAAGQASLSLSHPTASDGTVVGVSLSGEALAASNPRQCCPNGTACSAANSCTSTFNSAGFLFAASSTGAATTLPTQTAGTASGGFFLRAVKTNTSTQACEAALTGSTSVNWAAQCNNPSTCAGNLLSLSGASTAALSGNPNSGVSSSTAVTMNFDANGSAPFSFTHADVGLLTLWVSKTVNGATLVGNSNPFVTKPARLVVSAVQQSAAPATPNPGATSATGARFLKAGEAFTATITAQTSSGAAAPNFGREVAAESVLLTPTLVLPSGGVTGALGNATLPGSSFSAGAATVSNLSYSEVGIITLSASVADGDYLGAGPVSGSASGPIGRFVPARFALGAAAVSHRSGLSCSPASTFSYLGENFRLGFSLTAQNLGGGTTQNYSGALAKLDPSTATAWNLSGRDGSTVFSAASGRLSLGTASGTWVGGVASAVALVANAARASTPDGPFDALFGIAPVDSDGVAMGSLDMASQPGGSNDRSSLGSVALRHGRLRLVNAIGAADRELALPAWAQYWNGTTFATNVLDSCTSVPASAVSMGNLRRSLTAADTTVAAGISFSAGAGKLRLVAPGGGRSGTADVALSLGSTAADASCLQPWTPAAGDAASAGANLAYLRGGWCSAADNQDPSARATFGRQRDPGNSVYRRENF